MSRSFSHPEARLLLFAREPVPGQVKTRLQPYIGADRALSLHCALIEYTWHNLLTAGVAPVELWVAGNPRHALFCGLLEKAGEDGPGQAYRQQGGNLGQRMAHAAQDALQRGAQVLLVGADCPAVDGAYLRSALEHLRQGTEVVLGPAEDGGYVLLGLGRYCPELFSDMAWGTDRVLSDSVLRLRQAGRSHVLLDRLWDVDRPEDLPRLASLSPLFPEY